jgi:hypothetical protein
MICLPTGDNYSGARYRLRTLLTIYLSFFAFAHRAFCAAAIRARPAALIFRLPGLGDGFAAALLVALPSNSALAICSRRISASIAARISFVSMARIILAAVPEPKVYEFSKHIGALRVTRGRTRTSWGRSWASIRWSCSG